MKHNRAAWLLVAILMLFAMVLPTAGQEDSESAQKNAEIAEAKDLERKAGKLLFGDGENDQALVLYRRALEIEERLLGLTNPKVADTLMNLALVHRGRGDYGAAEKAYASALSIRESTTSEDVRTKETRQRYSCLLRRLGREVEARQMRYGSMTGEKSASKPVTGTVVNGRLIENPKPGYPKHVRKMNVAGRVSVSVTISEHGDVIEACATDGPPELALASEQAASRAKFSPTTLSGIPVKVAGAISYNFVAR